MRWGTKRAGGGRGGAGACYILWTAGQANGRQPRSEMSVYVKAKSSVKGQLAALRRKRNWKYKNRTSVRHPSIYLSIPYLPHIHPYPSPSIPIPIHPHQTAKRLGLARKARKARMTHLPYARNTEHGTSLCTIWHLRRASIYLSERESRLLSSPVAYAAEDETAFERETWRDRLAKWPVL